MIQLENVTKHFVKGRETVHALDGITLTVPRGALALVHGPSGSGKTTLINVIAGLTRPTSGAVTVAQTRLDGLSGTARAALRARKVAVVFQMFHLVPYLTARENVLLPTLAARPVPPLKGGGGMSAEDLMANLGIEHRANHFPSEMSAGERQRCALARALLNRPEVILADEPTGNLDEDSAQKVFRMLNHCRESGATILLVSHQPVDHIEPDLTLYLRDGRIERE